MEKEEIILLVVGGVFGAYVGLYLSVKWEDYRNACSRQKIIQRLESEVYENERLLEFWESGRRRGQLGVAYILGLPLIKNNALNYTLLSGYFDYSNDEELLECSQECDRIILLLNRYLDQACYAIQASDEINLFLKKFPSMVDKELEPLKERLVNLSTILKRKKENKYKLLLKLLPFVR